MTKWRLAEVQYRLSVTKAELYNAIDNGILKLNFGSSGRESGARCRVATSLMSFHVASYTEGLSTTRLRALVRLLARMAVAVDAQTAGP